ncbi:MAG: DNA methyltransferase [Sandaracinaceae bacterium]|nr:DNA methyltransferase [Sandaracinaceae bacterium]
MSASLKRRALSQSFGPILGQGDREAVEILRRALESAREGNWDQLTHGFHVWPARMHPAIVRSLIGALAPPRGVLLDPFAGSGTLGVEAMASGHDALLMDINPLSPLLVRTKTRITTHLERKAFLERAQAIAARSFARIQERRFARAPLRPEHRALYAPHTLIELAGLLEEIRAASTDMDQSDREGLFTLFSSIVTKFSNLRADTSKELVAKRIRKGLPTEFFLRKARELVRRWESIAPFAKSGGKIVAIQGDARKVDKVWPVSADLIISSPPYGGTYDYIAHHALRLEWLALDTTLFEEGEIGARRHNDIERWERELRDCLSSMRKSLKSPSSQIVLLIGDARIGGRAYDGLKQIASIAPDCGLELVAWASQACIALQSAHDWREHLVLLVPRAKK